MNVSTNFLKTSAVCAFICGVLMIIWFLTYFGYSMPTSLEDNIALQDNVAYTIYMWAILAALFFGLVVMLAVAGVKKGATPGLATTGFFFVFIAGLVNMILRVIEIFAVNYGWAAAYAAEETEEAVRTAAWTNICGFFGMRYALFFLVFLAFVIGLFLYFLATWRGTGNEKGASIFFLLTSIGMLLFLIGIYGMQAWLLAIMIWIVPILWAILYFIVGAWLWQEEAP